MPCLGAMPLYASIRPTFIEGTRRVQNRSFHLEQTIREFVESGVYYKTHSLRGYVLNMFTLTGVL